MAGRDRHEPISVYLEVGRKRVFAAVVAWPGWCRSGKTDDGALEALAAYAARYRPVVERAGITFVVAPGEQIDAAAFEVIERVAGSASTDFGVPGASAAADRATLSAADAKPMAALVDSAWAVFDDVVDRVPAELRKGPRGGGRDRAKIVAHVLDAEGSYVRKLGLRAPAPSVGDRPAIRAHRAAIVSVLERPSDGGPLVENGWLPRYAARRIAWHTLDHAWEMEDRA